jgi:hypothetical protein
MHDPFGANPVAPTKSAARHHGRYRFGENHAATTTTTNITASSNRSGDMARDDRTSRTGAAV